MGGVGEDQSVIYVGVQTSEWKDQRQILDFMKVRRGPVVVEVESRVRQDGASFLPAKKMFKFRHQMVYYEAYLNYKYIISSKRKVLIINIYIRLKMG